MDQVLGYVSLALYYGILVAFLGCYLVLLGHLLWNKQWLVAFLSVFFTVVFVPVGPFITLGPLIAMVIGWQEAKKWKIKNLMRAMSALLVVTFILLARTAYVDFMTAPPKEDPKAKKKKGMMPKAGGAPAVKGLKPH